MAGMDSSVKAAPARTPARVAGLPLRRDAVVSIATALFLAALSLFSLYRQNPPAPAPADAPAQEFSAARAMADLEAIAQTPHPSGTSAHDAVRDYLLGRLSRMGLSPEVQAAVVIRPTPQAPFHAGTFKNVVARLRGTNSGKAVVLVAHYDSVPTSPGASDDGAAVAAILETLRALQAGPPLKNDVICLLTDGEEVGLMGARAFVDEHPWAKEAGVVLNFEARGNGGPSLMFETSDGNEPLIREFAKAAPEPMTNSLLYEIYRALPNDTDLTMFKQAGYAGFNFAYIEGVPRYHTLTDSLTQLDARSLQHQGSYMLSLSRRFGNLNLSETRGGNAVYFDLLGAFLVHYPQAWAVPLAVLAALLFCGVAGVGLKRRLLTPRGIAFGFLALLLALVSAAAILTLLRFNLWALHSDYRLILQGTTYNSDYYAISFVAFALAVYASLHVWLRRKIGGADLYFGALCWWAGLAVWSSVSVPGASYLFALPLLSGVVTSGLLTVAGRAQRPTAGRLLLLYAGAVPAVVLFVPVIHILFVSLPAFAYAAVTVFVVLLLGLLLPLLELVTIPSPWALPGAALVAGLIFIIAATATSGFNRERPQPSNLFYALNADTGKAAWASTDDHPDKWSEQFFAEGIKRGPISDYVPASAGRFISSPAPAAPLDAPAVSLLSDTADGSVRTLSLRVTSNRRAPFLAVKVDSETDVLGATVNGKRIPHAEAPARRGPDSAWRLFYYAPPAEGVELRLEVRPGQPVTLRVLDQSFQLPQALTASLKPRPETIIPTPYPYNPYGDATLVSKSFSF